MNAIDTNLLVYVHDPRDPHKQQQAYELIRSLEDGALVWQVACEYLAASRKLEEYGYSFDQAWEDIVDLASAWTLLVPTSWDQQELAHDLRQRSGLSLWDSLLVAVCLTEGVETLYSEDLGDREIDGLRLVNPLA